MSRWDDVINQQERKETANLRFFKFVGSTRDTYRFVVCDAQAEPKTIAKFKEEIDADDFLVIRRERYIKTRK